MEALEDRMHPQESPFARNDFARAEAAVHDFLAKIDEDGESEYGDFMRRANLYLVDLQDAIGWMSVPVRCRLYHMQDYVQFRSSWDLDSTRTHLRSDALALQNLFSASPLDPRGIPRKTELEEQAPEHWQCGALAYLV